MEENSAAVECLILFYINTKHVLKTKQLDERVFLDQMIRHCRECGFDGYTNEEIRNTWKNLTLKYVELKKTGTAEDKEAWKYYEILDSCYEQSDFHNGVYPKFSEEMVWFLIECFLKRRGLEKTQRKNNMLNEIHKDFIHSGYLYITRQDIENKWKYLNFKYDKLKDDPEAFNKLPYLQALRGYREKSGKCLVKMIFTRALTEILIERFTEKKITCVIHGYDSEQLLSDIQYEFRELGFDFTQEEIKERWRKLTNIYSFIKAKGKHDSPWIYFTAMKEHFKDDFLFGSGKFERELREYNQKKPKATRQRSKSVGPDTRRKYTSDAAKTKLVVNVEQLDDEKMSPSPKKPEEKKSRASKRKSSPRKLVEDTIDDLDKSPKKSRTRSKSRETRSKSKEDTKKESSRQHDTTTTRKNNHLRKLSIDQKSLQERRGSSDIGSPGSKVHIINIDESKIDKKSGNLTINLPSITKQFSDNEFLPLKKRLRLGDDGSDKHLDDSTDLKDGFLGFPYPDDQKQSKLDEREGKRLTDEEMEEIMRKIHEDNTESCESANKTFPNNQNFYKPGEFDFNRQGTYENYNPSCLLIPKEEQQDNVTLQNYNPAAITPPPVLLLVIKVDGSNNPSKSITNPEDKKDSKESPSKNEPIRVKNNLSIVKPISPRERTTTTPNKSDSTVVADVKNITSDTSGAKITKAKTVQQGNVIHNMEVRGSDLNNTQIKNNSVISLTNPNGKICAITLKENVIIPSPEKNTGTVETQNKPPLSDPVQDTTVAQKVDENPVVIDTIPFVATETVIPATPPEPTPKKIRLPVKGGGNVKEIFLSPRELRKLAKIKPGDFKPTMSPPKINDNVAKTPLEAGVPPSVAPPKFKFISQVIKPPTTNVAEVKVEKTFQKPKSKVESSANVTCMLPPPTTAAANSKFLGTNNSSVVNKKIEEFDNESVFSEALGDDEGLKDSLLTTVIDFQEQNNQEFVEIKNLMKQNNLLQRETNRLLRLMLEKM